MKQKLCSKCQERKSLEAFGLQRSSSDGHFSYCKLCKKAYSKALNSTDAGKEYNRLQARKWRAGHPNYGVELCRINYYKDPKAYMARNKLWQARNPKKYREIQRSCDARRRARELNVESTLTIEEWQDILIYFEGRCAYCLLPFDKLEQDHLQPISKGGPHTKENVVPACRSCNASKGNKSLIEMLVTANHGREKLTSGGPLVEQLCQ